MDEVFGQQLSRLLKEFRSARLSQRIGTRLSDDVFVVCLNMQRAIACIQKLSAPDAKEAEVLRQSSELKRFADAAIRQISASSKQLNSPFNANGTVASSAKNLAWLLHDSNNLSQGEEIAKLAADWAAELEKVTKRK